MHLNEKGAKSRHVHLFSYYRWKRERYEENDFNRIVLLYPNFSTMKNILITALLAILFIANIPGCTKDTPEIKDEWVEIDSIMPNQEISERLNSIFLDSWNKNQCLNINYRTILYRVNSVEEYEKIDTCNSTPIIDFSKYTLTLGGFGLPSAYYEISDIKLSSNKAKGTYNFEISVDTCEYCYPVYGYKYFWRLYPKLNSEFQFQLLIKQY